MPDIQLIAVILLLAVAVVAGYFYLKRAERRVHAASTAIDDPKGSPVAPAASTLTPDHPEGVANEGDRH